MFTYIEARFYQNITAMEPISNRILPAICVSFFVLMASLSSKNIIAQDGSFWLDSELSAEQKAMMKQL